VLEKLADEDATCATLINGLSDGTYEGYLLKPMNCPHHIKIFASDHHSYRDLPSASPSSARSTAGSNPANSAA
jgi:threonyl-tRNA synthetase